MITRKDLQDSRAKARKLLREALPSIGSKVLRDKIEDLLKHPNRKPARKARYYGIPYSSSVKTNEPKSRP